MSPLLRFFRGLLYLAFLAVFVEVALQGFYYAMAGDFLFRRVGLPIYAEEPYAGYGNLPGLDFDHRTNEFHARYYVNQAGFRVPRPDMEYTPTKPSDTYRIMLLGPSFAFGWGVDYELSFAGILQRLLEERGFARKKKIELINAGIPGIPLAPQLAWFEQVGKRYSPDLVIQLVYGSMAVPDTHHPFVNVDDQHYLASTNVPRAFYWEERLKMFATVFYGWSLWALLDNSYSRAQSGERGNAVSGAGREMYAREQFVVTSPEVRESMHVYNELTSATWAAGARLLVVFFPLSYAIHREDESRWRHLGLLDIAREQAFDAAFAHYLNEQEIRTIDITQQLRKSAESGKRLYYWLDIHWTAAGNAAAAQAVADYISAERGVFER